MTSVKDEPSSQPLMERHRAHSHSLSLSTVAVALFCCVLWGGNSVAVKFALESFPPLIMAGLRFTLATMATAAWCASLRLPLSIGIAQIPIVLANGILLFLQIGTFTLGTAWSTSIHSIILVNSYPFFTALATHFWIPEYALTRKKAIGLFIAFAGVVMLFAEQITVPDKRVLCGDLLLVVSAAVLGFKFTYVKTLLPKITVPRIVFWEALSSVPMFFIAALLFESFPQGSLTLGALAGLSYQGLAVSAVAFIIWTRLLQHHSPNALSAISFTTPLFGMAAGNLVLSEPLTPSLFVGGALITMGIYWINSK